MESLFCLAVVMSDSVFWMKVLPGGGASRDMQVIKLSACYRLLAMVNLINRFISVVMEFARAGR